MKAIYYVVSGRNVPSSNCGAKIRGIVQKWKEVCQEEVVLMCASDYTFDRYMNAATAGRRALQKRRGSIAGFRPSQFRRLLRDILCIAADIQLYFTLRKLFSRKAPSVVWHRESRLSVAPMLIARKMGAVYVIEIMDHLDREGSVAFHWLHSWLERVTVTKANFVAVVSKQWASQARVQFGGREGKYLVVYNTVDIDKYESSEDKKKSVRTELGISDHEIVIGYSGSYAWYHNIQLMARLIAMTAKDAGKECPLRWLLVGDGAGRSRIEEAVAECGMSDRVTFIPWLPIEKTIDYYAAMDIGILTGAVPTICPIKVFEYMACGLAPLVPDTPANREVVKDRESGRLFIPGDVDSAHLVLGEMKKDRILLSKMQKAAKESVRSSFQQTQVLGTAIKCALADAKLT